MMRLLTGVITMMTTMIFITIRNNEIITNDITNDKK